VTNEFFPVVVSQRAFKLQRGGDIVEDREIVDLYWQRDERAIAETVARYGAYCNSIARNILHQTQDVEESVNDTWMNAWNSMPPHRPEILSTFLGKITRYICLKKWRERYTQKRGGGEAALALEELSESIPDGRSIDEAVQAKELAQIVNTFLNGLPETERDIFVCRYWYLDPVADISARYGCSQSKVKTMLWRTRKKLMLRLEKEGVFL